MSGCGVSGGDRGVEGAQHNGSRRRGCQQAAGASSHNVNRATGPAQLARGPAPSTHARSLRIARPRPWRQTTRRSSTATPRLERARARTAAPEPLGPRASPLPHTRAARQTAPRPREGRQVAPTDVSRRASEPAWAALGGPGLGAWLPGRASARSTDPSPQAARGGRQRAGSPVRLLVDFKDTEAGRATAADHHASEPKSLS